MSESKLENKIDYVEFPANDLPRTKAFYNAVFGWKFDDYGPDYIAFSDGRINGGFTAGASGPARGVLVIFYAHDLAAVQARIQSAGGIIIREIFSFPGGRRFHFTDPSGNELAVWSDATQ